MELHTYILEQLRPDNGRNNTALESTSTPIHSYRTCKHVTIKKQRIDEETQWSKKKVTHCQIRGDERPLACFDYAVPCNAYST